MAHLMFRVVTPYPITVNTGDLTGMRPATVTLGPDEVFVGDDNDPSIQGLLSRGAIKLASSTLLSGNDANTALPATAASFLNACFVDVDGEDSTAVRGSNIRQFKTISAASAAAQPGDVVYIGPGTYVEDVTLRDGLTYAGLDFNRTTIDGDVAFTPGPGDQDAVCYLKSLQVTGEIRCDGTDRDDPTTACYLYVIDSSASSAVLIGRPGLSLDAILIESCPEAAALVIAATNGVINVKNSEVSVLTAGGDCAIRALKSTFFGLVQTNSDISSVDFLHCEFFDLVTFGGPCLGNATARFCEFLDEIRLSNAATFDIRSSQVAPSTGFVTLFGGSTIQRDDGPFQGTNGVDDGTEGNVPAPSASDANRFLRGDGDWRTIEQPINASISTANTTPTAIWTFTLADETTYVIHATILAVNTAGTKRATYDRKAMVHRAGGGAATLNGASQVVGTDAETDAGLDAAFAVTGNTVELRVTGLDATDFDWTAKIVTQSVSAGPS